MSTREMLRGSPETWLGVNCTNLDPAQLAAFFPAKPISQRQALAAKAICNGTDGKLARPCPLVSQCLDWALETKQSDGVWGGHSSRERIRLRKERAAQVPRAAQGLLGRVAETKKNPGRLLPALQEHLLTKPQGVGRRQDLLHVSELIKKDFCPRAAYTRISRVKAGLPVPPEEAPHFQLDNIFEEGNSIHDKWQNWFWDLGKLWGTFMCYSCGKRWEDNAPDSCPSCHATRETLRYREVILSDKKNLIVGHADGEIRDDQGSVLIEIKSIGLGTVRMELPMALKNHTYKCVEGDKTRTHIDFDGLWKDIQRPFASHLKQGYVYLYLRDLATELHGWPPVTRIVFLYEYKPNQAVKEFVVNRDDESVQEFLRNAEDVAAAVNGGAAPSCVAGRNKCAKCTALDKLFNPTVTEISDGNDEQTDPPFGSDVARARPRRLKKVVLSGATRYGPPGTAGGSDGASRQRPDATAGELHSVGRLLRGTAGHGGS